MHAHYDAATDEVTALAAAENGSVLQLQQPAQSAGGTWNTILSDGCAMYWYGCYAFDASTYLISGFYDGTRTYDVLACTKNGGKN